MNRIVVIGNLTRDPELRTLPSGVSVCNFSVAVNRRFVNQQGVREADFFPVVAWRQQAENCAKFLKKGSSVAVSGELHTRNYEAQDGSKRFVIEIQSDEVQFLSRSNDGGGGGSFGGTSPSGASPQISDGGGFESADDDELPF